MKVLMQGRYGLISNGGGDKIQIENTAKELKKLGVEVDIAEGFVDNLKDYDLVHLFQLDWTPETYFLAKAAKDAGMKLVLSPIHHSVKEVKRFDDEYVFDFRRIARLLFKEQHQRDTFKNVYRSAFNPQKSVPTLKSIFMGLKNMHTWTLEMADVVLVQTNAEARDLNETYGVDFEWKKIPNGVGEVFTYKANFKNRLDFKDYIICVGRIEPRKNQLKVIEAVKGLRSELKNDLRLVLIGSSLGEKHFEYKWLFRKHLKANPWITHIERIPYEEMPSYYHFAKVGVSASWFETTGLTSLEALFCGTNAVASGERAKEYLGDKVSYCDPGDIHSIQEAIKKEYFATRPVPDQKMQVECTWANAAAKTLEVYKNLMLK
jgi:glycosyltransferase involved in cell wall biosynthesis